MQALLVALLFVSYAAAASNSSCFVLGVEGVSPFPPLGFISIQLSALNSSSNYSSAFIDQYNNYGIPFPQLSSNPNTQNCLVTLSPMQCLTLRGSLGDLIFPFSLSGSRECIWSNPTGPVKFGTWLSSTFFTTVNTSVISSWTTVQCGTAETHYTLLYNTSCVTPIPPTPPPTPPPSGDYVCCYYFSHSEKFESAFCQLGGDDCPMISNFTLVYNKSMSNCDTCVASQKEGTKGMGEGREGKKYSIILE